MDTKYELRKNCTPYYFENDIKKINDVILKEFEIFDGKEVKWGIREDYINNSYKKYYNTTFLFDNIKDRYNCDKKRILYCGDDTCVFHGKISNKEVLGKINIHPLYNRDFLVLNYFGSESVKIVENDDNTAFVKFQDNGLEKCLYFNYKDFRPCSNIFDLVYANNYFIKSYQINDKIYVYLGKVNIHNGFIKPYGYDINKREIIYFPINDNGLIDEKKMISNIQKSDLSIGFDFCFYKELFKINLIILLNNLNIDGYDVLKELDKENSEKKKCLVK